nr:immunoglobulin light chain junction region [Mus musculus]
CLQYEEFPYTF